MGDKPPILPSNDRLASQVDEPRRIPRPVPSSVPPPVAKPAPSRPAHPDLEPNSTAPLAVSAGVDTANSAEGNEATPTATSIFQFLKALPSWLASAILHMLLILFLGILYLPAHPLDTFTEVLLTRHEADEPFEEFLDEIIEPVEIDVSTKDVVPVETPAMEIPQEITNVPAAELASSAPMAVELNEFGETVAPQGDLLGVIGSYEGTGLEGRGQAARSRLLREAGGTPESEKAVARSLKWFSQHQYADGGWSFDHQKGACQSRCQHPGSYHSARIAATAMALLPYLGAGQTHKKGKYQEQVRGGLYFLVGSMKLTDNRLGDFTEANGRMYSHALATIALSEAYGMTQDTDLIQPAQLAVNYLIWAQNETDGGWRYGPNEALGDTSVVGWALMALKSAHMAYHLQIDPRAIEGVIYFLDTVQVGDGSQYSYITKGSPTPATTAIGLLSRMYLGWEENTPALQSGIDYLVSSGPMHNDFYYKYYATQVLRHTGGSRWHQWNEVMRQHLIETQVIEGHEKGSWYEATDPHSPVGGRHYCTSMATMILEVYYRHLPIYGARALEEEFPL